MPPYADNHLHCCRLGASYFFFGSSAEHLEGFNDLALKSAEFLFRQQAVFSQLGNFFKSFEKSVLTLIGFLHEFEVGRVSGKEMKLFLVILVRIRTQVRMFST